MPDKYNVKPKCGSAKHGTRDLNMGGESECALSMGAGPQSAFNMGAESECALNMVLSSST